jgi:phosphoribosylanthranilate isomerase
MNHPKIKICGIKDLATAEFCIQEGVDYLGFNFSPQSSRFISLQHADQLITKLSQNGIPKSITLVALFFKTDPKEIINIVQSGLFSLFQYVVHDTSFERTLLVDKYPLLPQYGVQSKIMDNTIELLDDLIILDKFNGTNGGGTGEPFVWENISDVQRKYLLAGGLHPENVREAIDLLQPFGVDVASGVESEKGIKDIKKIKRFIKNVR